MRFVMFAFIFSYKLVGGKLIFQKYLTNMPRIKKQSSGKLTKACFLIKYFFNIPSKKVFIFLNSRLKLSILMLFQEFCY